MATLTLTTGRASAPKPHRTSPPPAPLPVLPPRPRPSPVLPSVADLGRLIEAASFACEHFDAVRLALPNNDQLGRRRAERGAMLATDQEFALRDLVLTLPARSLGDAAVQVGIGIAVVEDCEGNELSEVRLAENYRQLRRIMASVLPVVTHAAGLTMAEVGGSYLADWCAKEFPERPGAETTADPDADLIGWCGELVTLDRECRRRMEGLGSAEAEEQVETELEPLYERMRHLETLIAAARPVTREGERALAQAAVQIRGGQPSSGDHEDLAWTLVDTLAGQPSIGPAAPSAGPDAALLQLCAEHVENMHAYNQGADEFEDDRDDPLWQAYTRTLDALKAAEPTTLQGMVALARVAKMMARNPDGSEDFSHGPAENVAFNLVNDLLRLHGGLIPETV